ncbi:MAG TPA: PEP-CTERM sorting domain-containing protein [Candidatus Hydrogenedentes bacterium]|nr:PEP-CTERM sorting domain-containing protein [Candidatus Hydrogenedentota bacterium]HOS03105.1 PEP-CTERM sorting domain-containing protein [Candidatus Hydrogenedentota bacterium]
MARSKVGLLVGLALTLMLASTSQASMIDLSGGDATAEVFGFPDTSLYAQGVLADANTLTSFSVALASDGSDTLLFDLLIVGALDLGGGLFAPDMTNILYNTYNGPTPQHLELSPNQTSMQTFGVTHNIAVTAGNLYFIVLDAFSAAGPEAGASVAAWADDQYAGGEFLYMNASDFGLASLADANDYAWDTWPYTPDLAFQAIFADTAIVPEPVTFSLLALGLAGLAIRRKLA